MKIPPVIATHPCIHCGALSQSKVGPCWLCYEEKAAPNPFAVTGASLSDEAASEPLNSWDLIFGVLLGLCVLMTLLIGIGLSAEDRGLLVPFSIFIAPAYAVTIVRGMLQFGTQKKARPASLFVTFIVSIVVTIAIVVILVVAAAIMFFLMCLGEIFQVR